MLIHNNDYQVNNREGMMMPAISIVVPVYNTERYIEKCLSSIKCQTYEDYEVILVDDGSTDGSGAICDKYAEIDSRFRVFHVANSGVAAARNFALGKCIGKFLTFVDSDDWVEPVFLEELVNKMNSESSEITLCDFYIEKKNETKIHSHTDAVSSSNDLSEMILRDYVHPGLWHKLFLKSIVDENNIKFSNYGYYEDFFFVMWYLHHISKVSFVSAPLYHYRIHGESLANNSDPQKRNDMYVKFIRNIEALDNVVSWKNRPDVKPLYYNKINSQKTRLVFFLSNRRDLLRGAMGYFPESVDYIDKGSFIGKAIYWATKYNFYLPFSLLFIKIKIFNR